MAKGKFFTFNNGNKVKLDKFTLSLPDGWKADCQDDSFEAYLANDSEDCSSSNYIKTSIIATYDGVEDIIEKLGVPELMQAYFAGQIANVYGSSIKRAAFVDAKGCSVLVTCFNQDEWNNKMMSSMGGEMMGFHQAMSGLFASTGIEDSYVYSICPCVCGSTNHILLKNELFNEKNIDEVFSEICSMASSVEVTEAFVSGFVRDLDRCKTEVISSDLFDEMVNNLTRIVFLAKQNYKKLFDIVFLQEFDDPSNIASEVLVDHAKDYLNDIFNNTIRYIFDFLEAFEYQKEHASQQEVDTDLELLQGCIEFFDFDIVDEHKCVVGHVDHPAYFDELCALLHKASPKLTFTESEIGSYPLDVNAPSTSSTYKEWFTPISKAGEPCYHGYNGTFNADAACWLYYQDHLYSMDDQIHWDGHTHSISGLQFNLANIEEIPHLIEDEDIRQFLPLLQVIMDDEGLRVPMSKIHPAIYPALYDGDLDGFILFNLQACAKALMITQPKCNEYMAVVDARLVEGIPDLLNLVARLIWDMRNYNGIDEPYDVTLVGSLNLEANVFFGDCMHLDDPVDGMSTETTLHVVTKPEVGY